MTVTKDVKVAYTRSGQRVRILATDRKSVFPVVGLVERRPGFETVNTWTQQGRFCSDPNAHPDDLVCLNAARGREFGAECPADDLALGVRAGAPVRVNAGGRVE